MKQFLNRTGSQAWAWCALVALVMIGPMLELSRSAEPATGETISLRTASEAGVASYYADQYHGKLTASGEVFNMHHLTAAHRRLPFGTRVKVTHLGSLRSVIVRINDRGPFVEGRVIDLSLAAARELQMVQSGLAQVKVEVLK